MTCMGYFAISDYRLDNIELFTPDVSKTSYDSKITALVIVMYV